VRREEIKVRKGGREGGREGEREGRHTYLAISRSRFETVARFWARAFPGNAVREGGREGGKEGRGASENLTE